MLLDYPNRKNADFLIKGFKEGFRLGHFKDRVARIAPNLPSVQQHPEVIASYINEELSKDRMLGPYSQPPINDFIVSPLGCLPKKTPNKYRIIQHLSYPRKGSLHSVNEDIDPSYSKVHYQSFQDFIECVSKFGPGAFAMKTDIDHAYKIIPLSVKDFNLLGCQFKWMYFIDKTLPMGASSASAIFEKFSSAIEWILQQQFKRQKIKAFVKHYMDDFIIIGQNYWACKQAMDLFKNLCTFLGIPLSPDKTSEFPVQAIEYLGLLVQIDQLKIFTPREKIEKALSSINSILSSTYVKAGELQSLAGLLVFISKTVPCGRAFIRRIYDVIASKHQSEKIKVSQAIRLDVHVWEKFLSHHTGVNIIPDHSKQTPPSLILAGDASFHGFGLMFQSHFAYNSWPSSFLKSSPHITLLELYAIAMGFLLFKHEMANKKVLVVSDNQAVVYLLSQKTTRCKRSLHLLRLIIMLSLTYNITFISHWIPSSVNSGPDLLSRLKINEFMNKFGSQVDHHPTKVSDLLFPPSDRKFRLSYLNL